MSLRPFKNTILTQIKWFGLFFWWQNDTKIWTKMEFWTVPNRLIFSNVQIGSSNGPNADSYLYWSSLNDIGRPSSSKLLKFSRNWFILGKSYFHAYAVIKVQPTRSYLISDCCVSVTRILFLPNRCRWRDCKTSVAFFIFGTITSASKGSKLRNWRCLSLRNCYSF